MEDKLTITLDIGGKHIPLTIAREQEEVYRKAGSLINEKLAVYSNRYSDRDNEAILRMALIDIALHYSAEKDSNDAGPYKKLLENMTSEIEDALKNDK